MKHDSTRKNYDPLIDPWRDLYKAKYYWLSLVRANFSLLLLLFFFFMINGGLSANDTIKTEPVSCFNLYSIDGEEDNQNAVLDCAGSKAQNLFRLQHIEGILVPSCFVITTTTYRTFVGQNSVIGSYIRKLDSLSKKFTISQKKQDIEKTLYSLAKTIREAIMKASFPNEIRFQLHGQYEKLLKNCENYFSRAVRSSGLTEDLPGAFTMEIGGGYPGIEIAADYGLGESVVGGEVSVDKWLEHPEILHIIKSNRGNEKSKYIADMLGSGCSVELCTSKEQQQYVVESDAVVEIPSQVKKIGEYYASHFSYPYTKSSRHF